MENIKISKILEFLNNKSFDYEFEGDLNGEIRGFSSLNQYKQGTLTWVKSMPEKLPNDIYMAVVQTGIDVKCSNKLSTENSKYVFFSILEEFFSEKKEINTIGKGTYISPNVKVGENVTIGCNCILDGDITIGDNTSIYNNVIIINRVSIGENCTIQSGVSIGHDGFSYYIDENSQKQMVKHYRAVNIGNRVHIGSNTCVVRGTIDNTVIGDDCKIDNLCHIAHNVELEDGVSVVAGSVIMGSAKLKKDAYIASGIVRNQIVVEENAFIGMGSAVVADVDKNAVVVGVPAKRIR